MTEHGQLHVHRRERIHQLHQQFPHPNGAVRFLDQLTMIMAVVMPATALPQVYKIFTEQSVDGLSLSMWVLYSIAIIPFLLYGIVHRVVPLIALNLLWMLVSGTIILGILAFQ